MMSGAHQPGMIRVKVRYMEEKEKTQRQKVVWIISEKLARNKPMLRPDIHKKK